MTHKEVKKSVIPEGDFQTQEGTLEENWARWNLESDKYLCQPEEKTGNSFTGRGQQVFLC
eukprot:9966103-Heterocapsa_arctica.AAC.1